MRVVIPGGEVFDLGTTETTPTVGIVDYSKRSTDDFGVTTVVERGFARRMSVRLGVPIELADSVLRKLAALRASTAQWVANDNYACLAVNGFLKDFDLDFSSPPLSYCTLTVEGLTETEPFVDAGGDPAPFGQTSTLRLLQPALIAGSALVSSNVVENDYATWTANATYALGDRVINITTHRIYESAVPGNIGNDPTAATGKWSDIGPTNRWAMFDQALGSTTERAGSIAVTVDAATINAVALLDVIGATVRVQATGYDKTLPVGAGAITFLDLPAGLTRAAVTITGSGTVSVGTLLVGKLVGLGVTEASPTAGITDYSRKEVDDFGAVTVVPRAWAKRMTTNALISTSAIDSVFSRIATVRATPSLWIGQAGFDSLTIYGFFKEFSIEAGDAVSKLSLSIEGLSTAGKVEPFAPGAGSVDWPNVGDPDGTKPANNATNGRDPTSPLGSSTVGAFEAALAAARAQLAYIDGTTIPTINTAVTLGRQAAADALAQAVALLDDKDAFLNRRIDSVSASGGYDDTNVYAEVRRVDQTAISRDGTIAQNISSVITSYQNADTITNARVEQVATSASNATQAVADLATSVNTRFSGVNTTLSSYDGRITTLATTVQGFAGRTDTLESQLNGSANSNLLARATNEATAAVDVKVGAVAQSVTTLSAQVLKVGVNFLPNSSGENGGVNTGAAFQWTAGAGPWFTAFSSSWGQVMQNNAPTTNVITIDSPRVACTPNTDYTAAADLLLISDLADARCYVDHVFERADGTLFYANNGRPVFGSRDFGSNGFRDAVWATARAPADAVKVFMRGVFTSDQAGSHRNIGLRQAKLEAGSGPYTAYSQEGTVGQNAASLTQQAGVLAGLDGRTSVYWSVTGSTGDGTTRIQLSKASGQTGLFYVEANMLLAGNLVVDGTITARKFDRTSMSREGSSVWQGSITPSAGQTITVPWNLSLSQIPALGRFIYEFTAAITTNANQMVVGTMNGKPSYLTYVEDTGGLTIVARDNQNNAYVPRANASSTVLATTDFVPSWTATIRVGSYDTGWINNGDSYERQVAASYTVSRIDLKVTWVAI